MKKIIIANWKMNPKSAEDAKKLFYGIQKKINKLKNTKVVFCPPFIYLNLFKSFKKVIYGAQNCSFKDIGAYTGEISPLMLKNIGCEYVILGHSDRRNYFQENGNIINRKIKSALNAGLTPILCVGENEKTEDPTQKIKFLKQEIEEAFENIPKEKALKIIITFEPTWAISSSGTGLFVNPDQILENIILIKKIIASKYGEKMARAMKILYGGSVNSKNISGFLKIEELNGFLIGACSLNIEDFSKAVLLAENKILNGK